MPAVCLYLQIHQPFRLRKFTIFDADPSYFDTPLNTSLLQRIAQNCYLPLTRLLLELLAAHQGRFRLALSITGTAVEQLEAHAPEVMQNLHALAQSGGVEFLAETSHHSLASLFSPAEFSQQIHLHRTMIKRLFDQTPTIFRNTELIYSDAIAQHLAQLGFSATLAEGWEKILNHRSAAFLYHAPKTHLAILLRNHQLSDAIGFRFTNQRDPEYPLTPEKFAHHISQIGGQLCNLFLDAETFGEHHPASSGIFDFLRHLPPLLLAQNHQFLLPSEIAAGNTPEHSAGELSIPTPLSWADESRDLSPWTGNAMQTHALAELYQLEKSVKLPGHEKLLADWRKLTTSDHFYYMSTKSSAGPDGQVHAHFRPYDSPYDAYINFMNVLDHLRSRLSE